MKRDKKEARNIKNPFEPVVDFDINYTPLKLTELRHVDISMINFYCKMMKLNLFFGGNDSEKKKNFTLNYTYYFINNL